MGSRRSGDLPKVTLLERTRAERAVQVHLAFTAAYTCGHTQPWSSPPPRTASQASVSPSGSGPDGPPRVWLWQAQKKHFLGEWMNDFLISVSHIQSKDNGFSSRIVGVLGITVALLIWCDTRHHQPPA